MFHILGDHKCRSLALVSFFDDLSSSCHSLNFLVLISFFQNTKWKINQNKEGISSDLQEISNDSNLEWKIIISIVSSSFIIL